MAEYQEDIAWLTLRIVYGWMYLYPAIGLLKDWPTTVNTTGLLFTKGKRLFAAASLVVMIGGGLMIVFGFFGQCAAVALLGFNVGGAIIHYRLAAMAKGMRCTADAAAEDKAAFENLATVGRVGHVTSAEKNFVLAAVALFFALMGTGPMSLGPNAGILSLL